MRAFVRSRSAVVVLLLASVSCAREEKAPVGRLTQGAASLAVVPITWDVIGLDSNDVTSGPNSFPVGARITNTGDATATDVTAAFTFTTANALINLSGPSAITRASLAPGASTDFYFDVVVTRNAAAKDTARQYVITGSAGGGVPSVSTPTPREVFVKSLVSQNRNEITTITGPTSVKVGQVVDYVLTGKTAPGGYEQLVAFLTFSSSLFEVLSTSTTYTAPAGGTNTTTYADACGWDPNPLNVATYLSCIGPVNYPGGKAGGTVQTTYTVRIAAPGTTNLTSLIYDFSGASFHYNSDFGGTVLVITATANGAPVATADSYSTGEDTPLAVPAPGVLANDSDPDSDPLTAVLVSGPSNGSLVLATNGGFTYTPAADYNGPDSFTYKATDGAADSATVVVSLTVAPVNDVPVAIAESYTTAEDTPLIAVAPGVLGNDTDVEGSTLTAILVSGVANGVLALNTSGSFTYTPDGDFSGPDSFTYKANDGTADSNTVTVSLTVDPVNDPPVTNPDAYLVTEDMVLTVLAAGVLANDTDADGDTLAALLETLPAGGSLSLGTDGSLTYTPNPDFNGPDSFTYRTSDGTVTSAPETVSLTVSPVNDAPVALPDSGTVDQGGTLSEAAPGVLGNDSDVDGDAVTAVLVADVSNGTLTLNPDGSYSYTPTVGFSGTDFFTYFATDGALSSATVTVTITVNPLNDAPVAGDDVGSTPEDTALVALAPGVLGNDTDGDADPLSAVLVAGPSNGTLTLNTDGSYTYSPDPDFEGVDTFTYQAEDGIETSNVATVTITVDPVDDAPVAVDDAYVTAEDSTLTVLAAAGVLGNDFDADGDPLASFLVTGPASGALSLGTDGAFTYTPDADFAGADSFTYFANDGALDSGTVTVTLTITPVNDAPVVVPDAYSTAEDTPLMVVAAGVLSNDTDVDGDPLGAVLASPPGNGILTLNTDGSFVYTPNADFAGGDSFTYQADDGSAVSAAVTVTLTVTPVNDAPFPVDDGYAANEETPLSIAAPGVLSNDGDVDGNPLAAVLVSSPANGTLSLNADGSFDYTPNPDFNGVDSFTYRASDGVATSGIATVSLTVNPVNDVPVAVADARSVDQDTVLTVVPPGVLGNDSDIDGDALGAVLDTNVSNGTLALAADGSFTYTPTPGFSGTDSFVYRASDGTVSSAPVAVTITVIPDNLPPDAVDDIADTFQTSYVDIDVRANDTDPDSDPLTIVSFTDGSSGEVALLANGRLRYIPGSTFGGVDTFIYMVSDGNGGTDTATVTVTVEDDNDGDGIENSDEVTLGTDMDDPDTDGDGIDDGVEVGTSGTDPADDDTDDDGLLDGTEDANGNGVVDPGETGALDPDSDDDGLQDGTESGLTTPQGNDTHLAVFTPDADPNTTTDPLNPDSDGGGILDGDEDLDHDGALDPGETDPTLTGDDEDADGDGWTNIQEAAYGTNPYDADTDDDGLLDSADGSNDTDGDGLVDARDPDSDGDGVFDGTEAGVTEATRHPDTDPNSSSWRPDGDSGTTTNPDSADTDGDGLEDGQEDADGDGWVDVTETDPSDSDTDGDGLGDGLEVNAANPTDPLDPDSDDDGLTDGVEDANGNGVHDGSESDPNNPDTDGGGVSDGEEVGRGSNPTRTGDDFEVAGSTGCSVGPTTADGGWGLLLTTIALAVVEHRRRRRSRNRRAARIGTALVVVGIAAVVPGGRAEAQEVTRNFVVQQFRPAPGAHDVLGVESPRTNGSSTFFVSLWGNYASAPFRLIDPDDRSTELFLLKRQTALDLAASMGFGSRLELGAALPLTVDQTSERAGVVDASLQDRVKHYGLGDVRVMPKAELLSRERIRAGVALPVTFPTGRKDAYLSHAGMTYEPRVLAETALPGAGRGRVAANLGLALRETRRIANLRVGNAVTFGAAGEAPFRVSDRRFAALLQVSGELGVDGGAAASKPIEAVAGVRWTLRNDMSMTLGGGTGLVDGYGAPRYRMFLAFAPAGRRAPLATAVPMPTAAPCPCPEPLVQATPFPVPEPTPVVVDEPDPPADTDGDGILDAQDTCPAEKEDMDGFDDADGCPEPDNDRDGILDDADACRDQAETMNGFSDTDGCPDAAPRVILQDKKILILDKVYFATNLDVILEKSFPILEEVAVTMKSNPQIRRIRVEGHTDSDGTDAANLDLSKRRAQNVRTFLIERGIASERLESEGYGEGQPIVSNAPSEGKAENRRVEFIIVDP